jgi:ribosomal protein S18 acetylase RimI-like enzyme
MMTTFVKVSAEKQIEMVESLAKEIWTEHYTPIIGREQVCYMLDRFQTKKAVSDEIGAGVLYFLIESGGELIGYVAVQPKRAELFLSKIYIRSSNRSSGYGRKAVQFIERLARKRGLRKISLTVNKNNTGSLKAYEKLGFRNLGPVIKDIGGGFVMDDYRMEKNVSPLPGADG